MWFVVHTSAFTTHKSAIPENLWFIENFNSDMVKKFTIWAGYLAGMSLPCADFRELATLWVLDSGQFL